MPSTASSNPKERSASAQPRRSSAIIRASEIGQYAYCQRAWWLGSVYGHASSNQAALLAGDQAHSRHGRGVAASLRWRQVGHVLLVAGGLLALFLLLRLLGVAW